MPAETEPRDDTHSWIHSNWIHSNFEFLDSVLLERMRASVRGVPSHVFYLDSFSSTETFIGQRAGKSRLVQSMVQEHMSRLYGTSYGSSSDGCLVCAHEKPKFRNKKLEEVVDRSRPRCLSQIQETLLPGQVPVLGRQRLPHPWLRETKLPSPLTKSKATTLKERAVQILGDVHVGRFGTFMTGLEPLNRSLRASFFGEECPSALEALVAKFHGHDGSYKRQKNEARKLA